jgi:exopolyphosphatase/guanosine-5'-triphosphate,3'-diphosphate pyrophosphatase
MKRHVRSETFHSVKAISKGKKYDLVIGSSGTIINLAEMASRAFGGRPGTLRLAHLRKLTAMLRPMTLEQRRQVPGINPERADIILGGAAILETLMEELKIEEIITSDRGASPGCWSTTCRASRAILSRGLSVRETPSCSWGGRATSTRGTPGRWPGTPSSSSTAPRPSGIFPGEEDRELLGPPRTSIRGDFISFHDHHIQSHTSSERTCWASTGELAIMANLVRYHGSGRPAQGPRLAEWSIRQQKIIVMSTSPAGGDARPQHANL